MKWLNPWKIHGIVTVVVALALIVAIGDAIGFVDKLPGTKATYEKIFEKARASKSGWFKDTKKRGDAYKRKNVYFTVVSNGRTAEEWAQHFEKQRGAGRRIYEAATGREIIRRMIEAPTSEVLRRITEAPTNGVVYNVVVYSAYNMPTWGSTYQRWHVQVLNAFEGWKTPHWEVACLIREKFTKEDLNDMGLQWIFVAHKPIKDSDGNSVWLGADTWSNGYHSWDTFSAESEFITNYGGFAFVVP